jgi:hypothetical protein
MVAFRMARDPPPASPSSSVAEHTAERKETEIRKAIVLLGALALGLVTSVGAAASPGRQSGHRRRPRRGAVCPQRTDPKHLPLLPRPGRSGERADPDLVDEDRATEEPHTVTLIDETDLPTDVEEVFGCQAPGEPCGEALAAHFGGGPMIDVGTPGLDAPGDSLLFFADGSISGMISAPAGSTLFYLCAIHPWMHGSIIVR